jgi:predicted small lipoprotein YifL
VKPLAIALLVMLAGCGYIGPIYPPSIDMPTRVIDLRVAEYGDKIRADFTIPSTTTEALPLKTVERVELRVGLVPNPINMDKWASTAKVYPIPSTAPGAVDFSVPAQDWIGKEPGIAVRSMGPKGKWSDWSALRILPVSPPLATPTDFKVENQRDGVGLTWKSPAAHFRIYRTTADLQPEQIGDSDHPEYLDSTIEFGTKYTYYVQAVNGELQQSETALSPPITPENTFAPSTPTGLAAEQGINSIDLSWERNTEPRFQGYNVYRSVDGGAPQKVAPLVTAPTYSDHQIESGKKYSYTVTAVGVNGKESAPSAPFEITAQ